MARRRRFRRLRRARASYGRRFRGGKSGPLKRAMRMATSIPGMLLIAASMLIPFWVPQIGSKVQSLADGVKSKIPGQ